MSVFDESTLYTGAPCTAEMVRAAETKLGYRLPSRYVEVLQEKNGGGLARRCIRTSAPTSWAPDHIKVNAILGVGGHEWSIDSDEGGSPYMITEWGYPSIGVVICEMPSAGHDAVMLDYSECGPEGEPRVTYVDDDHSTLVLATSFSDFLEELEDCANFA